MIEFTTTVSKYLVNIYVEGKTLDPIVIWGQFATNVTSTNFPYNLPLTFN